MRARKIGRIAVYFLVAVAVVQGLLWLTYGRYRLDDAVVSGIVEEFTEHLSAVEETRWPSYFYLCPTLTASLAPSTRDSVQRSMEGLGIEFITMEDLTAAGGVPRKGAVAASLCTATDWASPVVALVEIQYGTGPDYVIADHSLKELRVFVLGQWLRLKRYGGVALL